MGAPLITEKENRMNLTNNAWKHPPRPPKGNGNIRWAIAGALTMIIAIYFST